MIDLEKWTKENNLDDIRTADITELPAVERRGFQSAIILVKGLAPEYIQKLIREGSEDHSGFSDMEKFTDKKADALAELIREEGYDALSQSERSLFERKEYSLDTQSVVLPHKTIGVLAGLGWIGKNDLLVTEKYGSALSICTVLTNIPLDTKGIEIEKSRCYKCDHCIAACEAGVLSGATWTPGINREEIVDALNCDRCLMCMAKCRYSRKYAERI